MPPAPPGSDRPSPPGAAPVPPEPYQSPTPPSPPPPSPFASSSVYQSPQYPEPAGEQPPPPYPGGQPAGQPGAQRPTNSLAVAALVCAVAGLFTVVSAPVGAVLGHLSLRQIAQTGEEGAGLAKAAIWVGWIITGLVLVACCAAVVVAVAVGRVGEFSVQ